VAKAMEKLRLLSPEAILGRGYALVQKGDGSVVRSVAEVKTGDLVKTRLADGSFESEVR
jgi:exodeoxyribonuclease VII large subunit